MRFLLCSIGLVVFTTGAIAELSQISVRSNQFVTAEGKAVVFKGLATSDPDKLQRNEQWNKKYFEQVKAWGANVVRIPVHPGAWRIHGKEAYIKLLDQSVAWSSDLGLYVVIDWHSIGNLPGGKFFPVAIMRFGGGERVG